MSPSTPTNPNLLRRLAQDLRLLILLIRDFAKGRYRYRDLRNSPRGEKALLDYSSFTF